MIRITCHSTPLRSFYRSFRLFLVINTDAKRDHDNLSTDGSDANNKDSASSDESTTSSEEEDKFPEEPTTCCMSGCANCVWLDYVDKMNEYFKDGTEMAIQEIEEKVHDPNMKAFLLSEIRMRAKFKKE